MAKPKWQSLDGVLVDGKYRLHKPVGKGGAGQVYVATHELTHRSVAVKVLSIQLSKREDAVKRFLFEARVAASIQHPNLVDILDMGFEEGVGAYLVMEHLEGEALSRRIRKSGPIPSSVALGYLLPVMEVLSEVHRRGIVHRDLKPSNLYLTKDHQGRDLPKLLDFGIAKQTSDTDAAVPGLTRPGIVLGTPSYMSPEQFEGSDELGVATDVWAMGVMLYECIAGRVPFKAKDMSGVYSLAVAGKYTPLSEVVAGVDPVIEAVIQKALSPRISERFASMDEMAEALKQSAAWSASVLLPQAQSGSDLHTDTARASQAQTHMPAGPTTGQTHTYAQPTIGTRVTQLVQGMHPMAIVAIGVLVIGGFFGLMRVALTPPATLTVTVTTDFEPYEYTGILVQNVDEHGEVYSEKRREHVSLPLNFELKDTLEQEGETQVFLTDDQGRVLESKNDMQWQGQGRHTRLVVHIGRPVRERKQ